MSVFESLFLISVLLLALHVCNFAYNVSLRTNAGPRVRGALRAMLRRLRNAIACVAGALWLLWNWARALPGLLRALRAASLEELGDEELKAADGGCDVAERRRLVAAIDRAAMAQEACR